MKNEFEVNPWNVSGSIDYGKLIKNFGTQEINNNLRDKLKDLHPLIKRGLYFSHRELDLWIKDAESKKKVSVVSGRGPSEKMHLGHLIPFIAVKSLQDKYGCNVYIPISEDEKFFVKPNLSIEDSQKFADDNIKDIIALGFDPKKTFIIKDFSYGPLYKMASRIAKLMSYSNVKAVFGLQPENNIGWSFYPAVQAAHILFPQFVEGPHRTVVPVGIDQDPFIRLTRDIAEHSSLGFVKPGALHAKFIPSLKGASKMSASDQENEVIYLTDSPEEVKRKVNKYAFSGGRDTLEEHRKLGGDPDIDISFQYLRFLFEEDDKKLKKIEDEYRAGKLLSGELKKIAIDKINEFLKKHQESRKKMEKNFDRFIYKG